MQKWNHSLDVSARTCRRKVFLGERFASHKPADKSPRRETFLLKKAVDLSAWRGKIVHTAIHRKIIPALRMQKSPDFDAARQWALELVDRQAVFSRGALYRDVPQSKAKDTFCILRADFLGDGLTAADLKSVKSEVANSLKILETQYADLLERVGAAQSAQSEREIRNFKLDSTISVKAILDLIFVEDGNRYVIVDWKVGDEINGNARAQLYVYAFAVIKCGEWGTVKCSDVELIEANLVTGERSGYVFTEADLEAVDERIFTGAKLLEPIFARPVTDCSPDDFAPTSSPNACRNCSVCEVCNGTLFPKTKSKFAAPKLF